VSTFTQRMRGRSEIGVALLLIALGVLAIVDANQIPETAGQRGPVGPAAVPIFVGALLIVIALFLARDVLAGGHGEAEAGEDIDLSHPSDWRTVLILAGAFLANIVLIERAGWPISGAVLFFGVAYALGSRHIVRDVILSFALSFGSYFLLGRLLDVRLPGGVLEGIL
jgi:putative tricarboxylic transport membrane protein